MYLQDVRMVFMALLVHLLCRRSLRLGYDMDLVIELHQPATVYGFRLLQIFRKRPNVPWGQFDDVRFL
jgi:hypothetical protein